MSKLGTRSGGLRRVSVLLASAALTVALSANAQSYGYRRPVHFPDLPGYVTLKCDFHVHTIFSDGQVWPTVRVEEAWREGLDAIALSDHVEYQPHRRDVSSDRNRPFEIAAPLARSLGLILIRGAEITRDMPPGHLNAIFLSDVNQLVRDDWRQAVLVAVSQGAFIFWNHPGWKSQQPDGIPRWYKEHDWLMEQKALHGIEIANDRDFYPLAFAWAIEKKLTPLANSDVHSPIDTAFNLKKGEHRPITLVFARDRSEGGIKEALFSGRTIAWFEGFLMGAESFVRPLVVRSITIENPDVVLEGRSPAFVRLHNSSSADYVLKLAGEPPKGIRVESDLKLPAGKTALLRLSNAGNVTERVVKREVTLSFDAVNVLVGPERPLRIELPIRLTVN